MIFDRFRLDHIEDRSMDYYDVMVIGAGNGGLTAACTLAQQGLKTLLLEQHNVPGGYATSFCRGRFEFEVSLHQLSGLGSSEKPGPLRTTLDALGVTDMLEWVDMGKLYKVMVPGFLNLVMPANREGAILALTEAFPDERQGIVSFFDLVYLCWNDFHALYQYNFDAVDITARVDPDASIAGYPTFFTYAFKNLQVILDQYFQNPLLKLSIATFSAYSGLPKDICLLDLALWLFFYIEYGSYHIKGGSQALSNALVKKYLEYGGAVRFNWGVKKILVEEGAVTGVITETGDTITARQIVSNASPLTVYRELIDRAHVPRGQLKAFTGSTIGPSTFILYVALDCDHSQLGIDETTNFIFTPQGSFMFSCYNVSNPDCSPPGTTILSIVNFQTDQRWLATPPDQYFEKKYAQAEKLLRRMEQVYPGIRDHIEEIEVSTPLTNIRFTGAPGGAIAGFFHYSKDYYLFPMDRPLIQGLHFVGAWANNPGGFHPTLMHGRAVGLDIARQWGKAEHPGTKVNTHG